MRQIEVPFRCRSEANIASSASSIDFVNPDVPVGEDVVAAYVSTYKEPLPGKAVKALRSGTKLDCKPIAAALKAVAAGGGESAGEP